MSIKRSYECDGCGKALVHGQPILHVEVEATVLEDGTDDGSSPRRRRKRMRMRGFDRHALLDFCGDCRVQPLAIGALLDKRSPPPVKCATCSGSGMVLSEHDGFQEDCPSCDGDGEVFA